MFVHTEIHHPQKEASFPVRALLLMFTIDVVALLLLTQKIWI